MRVLVVKLTSMGDVLHLLPALSDLKQQHPGVLVDWMVEKSFAEIPAWHPSVDRVITVSTRRWRHLKWANISEFLIFLKTLRSRRYDYVIDAQGLMKSAVFGRFAKLTKSGLRAGFSGDSIKESPAARLYTKKIVVARQQHAITRLRKLFAGCFEYSESSLDDDDDINYGIKLNAKSGENQNTIMLFHGTTWPSKHLPDQMWRDLADLIIEDGYQVKVCWGNEVERQRAEWIAKDRSRVQVLPKSDINGLGFELAGSTGAIAVDTGLGHMAAALSVPCVSVYGATDARLTGTAGAHQIHIQTDYPCSPCLLKQCDKLTQQVRLPPCYQRLSAASIWQKLYEQIV